MSRTDSAAKKLAELTNYPWDYMPEEGRQKMREQAAAILAAGVAPTKLPIPPAPVEPLSVVYVEGWNAAVDEFFGGAPAPEPLVITVTKEKTRAEILNTPELLNFSEGVTLEALHQRERWASDGDAGKQPSDWFWLIGYLAGKALQAQIVGNTEKALHHTISSAAALANWHAAIRGTDNSMRPGIDAASQPDGVWQSHGASDTMRHPEMSDLVGGETDCLPVHHLQHDPYTDADADRPDVICDSNGQVVLDLCKRCGKGEAELLDNLCITHVNQGSKS